MPGVLTLGLVFKQLGNASARCKFNFAAFCSHKSNLQSPLTGFQRVSQAPGWLGVANCTPRDGGTVLPHHISDLMNPSMPGWRGSSVPRTRFLCETSHPVLRLLRAARLHLQDSPAAPRLHPTRGPGIQRGPGAVGVLRARLRAPGAPQTGAGDGVKAADGWGSPPQFRDRPVCGKQHFTGLEATFLFLLRHAKLPLPCARGAGAASGVGGEADGGICTGEAAREGAQHPREGAQHPRAEHGTG